MTNKYDRVSYPDDLHFARHGDGDGEEFHRTGNGIYNDYTVDMAPKQYTQRFKIACFSFERSNKKNFFLCGAAFAIVVIILMIIIIASAGSNQKKSSPTPEEYGLMAYPKASDGSSLIEFDPVDHFSYQAYYNNMMHQLADYSMVKQLSQPDKYLICTKNTTSLAKNELCTQTEAEFGTNCHQYNMFGWIEGKPCVLLRLNIKLDDPMPKPFNLSGSQNAELNKKLGEMYSENSVSISCEGKAKADKDIINATKSNITIKYHPKTGYPLYYFLGRKHEDYFAPGVMVQFNTIPFNHVVHVKCTAWAANFNNGKPADNDVYSTEFSIHMHRNL